MPPERGMHFAAPSAKPGAAQMLAAQSSAAVEPVSPILEAMRRLDAGGNAAQPSLVRQLYALALPARTRAAG